MGRPVGMTDDHLSEKEKLGIQRFDNFKTLGCGYLTEHGTRPSTIGHVVSASPMALLAWLDQLSKIIRFPHTNIYRVGEKFLEWVDDPLSPEHILESIMVDCIGLLTPSLGQSTLIVRYVLIQAKKVCV